MNPNVKPLLNQLTTLAAQLAGVLGVYKNQFGTSFFRFVPKQFLKYTQTSVRCTFSQVVILDHETKCQIF